MNIRDYDPAEGQAFQGDVSFVPVPAHLVASLKRNDEIAPIAGRLILQEGEISGHHHAIDVLERGHELVKTSLAAERLMSDAIAGRIAVPTARLFRDGALAQAMVSAGVLTRADLCIGFLEIADAPFVVSHEEHDGIRLPAGLYYIGGQVESAGAEERRVAD